MNADEDKFEKWARLTVECAAKLAPYQSPTFRAVVVAPAPDANELERRKRQSDKTATEASERAERLRPILAELTGVSANQAAAELNRRKVPTPAGGQWYATQVIRLRQRLDQSGQAP